MKKLVALSLALVASTLFSCEEEPTQDIHKFQVYGLEKYEYKINENIEIEIKMNDSNIESSKLYFLQEQENQDSGNAVVEKKEKFNDNFSNKSENNIFRNGTIVSGYLNENLKIEKNSYRFFIKPTTKGKLSFIIVAQNFKDLRRSFKKKINININE